MAGKETALHVQQFLNGTDFRAWELLGAHPGTKGRRSGFIFRTWAPHAQSVAVCGDFNEWNPQSHPMKLRRNSGVWEVFIPGFLSGAAYQYAVTGPDGKVVMKSDPFARRFEQTPAVASQVWVASEEYVWGDADWLDKRAATDKVEQPVNIYEVHLGSWERREDGGYMTYGELGELLAEYAKHMGYTHVELLPVTEHLSDASWGYHVAGYFAPTSRFGTPEDFKGFVDKLHRAGIGVILDWVPAHFPREEYGLHLYDGTPCYEYADPLKADHANWSTRIFDFGKPEVRSFLISSALYWLEEYHIDGLRLDSVAAMLYLDFDRQEGEWRPNIYGGRENLEAVQFLQQLNLAVKAQYPEILMIAEETTGWPMVTRPPKSGGLGFYYKWSTGWVDQLLQYVALAPEYRTYHYDKLTFSTRHAFSENFILALSHNQMVHGARSLLSKFPGDQAQKFAGDRAFLGYMMSHPGKKLLFMGSEFGQGAEWDSGNRLEWDLLLERQHKQLRNYVRVINHFYRKQKPLWQMEDGWEGFRWVEADDNVNNVVVFCRRDKKNRELVVVCNFSDKTHTDYRFGVNAAYSYKQVLSSNEKRFGGTGEGNPKPVRCEPIACHSKEQSISITTPAMSCLWLSAYNPVKTEDQEIKTAKIKAKPSRKRIPVSPPGR